MFKNNNLNLKKGFIFGLAKDMPNIKLYHR